MKMNKLKSLIIAVFFVINCQNVLNGCPLFWVSDTHTNVQLRISQTILQRTVHFFWTFINYMYSTNVQNMSSLYNKLKKLCPNNH